MSEAKFTRGPWNLHVVDEGGCGWEIHANGFKENPLMADAFGSPFHSSNIHDAHLIAAAPELYEALAETERYFSNADGLDEDEYYYRHRVRSALAKARGETL